MTEASAATAAPVDVDRRESAQDTIRPVLAVVTGPRAAAWVFGALVAVSFPLLLFVLGDYFWFFRDDWQFLAERELTIHDLFEPHNAHWSTTPVLIFRVLYRIFGLQSYVPYQAVVVAMHLGVVVLLRVIMRRAGVSPWLATTFAGVALLLGSGREDILWAFQIGFTGSILFSLSQLVLADHDGPIGRRDVAALGLGILAVMTASPAIALTVVIGLVLLVRRGWWAAAFQTAPLGLAWLVWSLITHPDTGSPFGRPDLDVVVEWVWNGLLSTFLGIVDRDPLAIALVVVLVAGVALTVLRPEPGDESTRWGRVRGIATPLALFGGIVVFMVMSVQARWIAGPDAARASRYVYFYVVCTLPLLAVAAEAFARRWRATGPVLAALVLVGVPANIARFDDRPFGPEYHQQRQEILLNAVRMPDVRGLDPDLRPIPDPYMGTGVDMGFLLGAYDSGKLDPPSGPVPARVRDPLEVVLTFAQSDPEGFPAGCRWLEGAQRMTPSEGTELVLTGDVQVRVVRDGAPSRHGVILRAGDGSLLTVERGGVEFDMRGQGQALRICEVQG